jgi:hypothetical protein
MGGWAACGWIEGESESLLGTIPHNRVKDLLVSSRQICT